MQTDSGSQNDGFALMGLVSRGGFSNWVAFFFPAEVVIVDVGMGATLKAGVFAGVGGQFGALGALVLALTRSIRGPRKAGGMSLREKLAELKLKAKHVITLRDDQISDVRFVKRMLGHQLIIKGHDQELVFGLRNRKESQKAIQQLESRIGSRFTVSESPIFALLERYVPLLVK